MAPSLLKDMLNKPLIQLILLLSAHILTIAHAAPLKVGIQLWSVHDEMKHAPDATLENLANMGFDGVEFAGEFGHYKDNPEGLHRRLQALGLEAPSAHVQLADLLSPNRNDILDFYRTLEVTYIIVPWDDRAWSTQDFDAFIFDLNRAQALVTAAGFEFGYHNHADEFRAFKNSNFWDEIANQTDPSLILQLDLSWVKAAGQSPSETLMRHQGRTPLAHFKAYATDQNQAIIGQDLIDWPTVIKDAMYYGDVSWAMLEQEQTPSDMTRLEAIEASYRGLLEAIPTSQPQFIGSKHIDEGHYQFSWANTEIRFSFEGTGASINLEATADTRFEVIVNKKRSTLWVNEGSHQYLVAQGLPLGLHHVRVIRVTEPTNSMTQWDGHVDVEGRLIASAEQRPQLLVIGDSITAGYGVEGLDANCGYSQDSSNALLSYAAIASESTGYDLIAWAWSGIGVSRSFGETERQAPTMLERIQFALPNKMQRSRPPRVNPELIAIALGTNDLWDGDLPEDFIPRYQQLVRQLNRQYHQRATFLILSPMLTGERRQQHRLALEAIAAEASNIQVVDLGAIEPSDGYGCHSHPNVITQTRMAERFIELIHSTQSARSTKNGHLIEP